MNYLSIVIDAQTLQGKCLSVSIWTGGASLVAVCSALALESNYCYESLNANLRLILFTWVSKWKGDP
jgi:hypothetical protein